MIERITELEKKYVLDVLSTSFSTSSSAKYMTLLEHEFAKKFKSAYAISHVNGTATMHSALEAFGIGEGDEVIVPPLTMSSTSLVVLQANATPIFADVDPETFVINATSIKKAITNKTKAIITVALYGVSPDMDPIMALAKEHNLLVIEDNAQAFLSYYKDRLVGTLGHCASFSFQSSKHITAGEGGIITTNDEELAIKIRKMSGLGYSTIGSKKAKISKHEIQHPSFERHDFLGWNYRMSELNCAVTLGQLEHIEELIQVRIDTARLFDDVVDKCEWLTAQKVPENCKSSYWAYTCKLDTSVVSWEKFREIFLSHGGDPFYGAWQLTYLEPLFRDGLYGSRKNMIKTEYKKGLCPIAEEIQPKLIQFKTNYWDINDAKKQAKILAITTDKLG